MKKLTDELRVTRTLLTFDNCNTTQSRHVMLHVVSCYASRYATRHVTLRVMSCYMSHHATCHVMLCQVMLHVTLLVMSWYMTLSC